MLVRRAFWWLLLPLPQVEAYCADNSPEASLNLGSSMLFIRSAFEAFRQLVRAGGAVVGPAGVSQKLAAGGTGTAGSVARECGRGAA